MPNAIDNIKLANWDLPTPIATSASGHRDGKKLAFRLTLTPFAGGVYPVKDTNYVATFRDAGSDKDIRWDVRCVYIPSDTAEPFEFDDIFGDRKPEREE